MKLTDILNESQLDEFIPLTKQGRMIKRAEKAGKKDAKATLDKMIQNFAAHLGTQGLKFKTASTDDVIDYLKSRKIDISDIDTNAPMTPARIKKIFQVKVKAAIGKSVPKSKQPPSPKLTSVQKAAMALSDKEKLALAKQLSKGLKTGTGEKIVNPDKVSVSRDKSGRFGKLG